MLEGLIGLILLYLIYTYFWPLLGVLSCVAIVCLAFRYGHSLFLAQTAQVLRRYLPNRLAAQFLAVDQPLTTLRDEDPSTDAAVQDVGDGLEHEDLSHKKGREGEQRVNRILASASLDYLSDIYLRDQDGNLTQVDHIAKMHWGFLVIETKNYAGFISRTRNPEVWKQTFDVRSNKRFYRFQSPIKQNDWHVTAVRQATGLTNHLVPMVVFAGPARLSRTVNEEVVAITGLKAAMRKRPAVPFIPEKKRDRIWENLKQRAAENAGKREEHLAGLKSRRH